MVEVVSQQVFEVVKEIIDFAMAIVIGMIVYYVVRIALYRSDEGDEETEVSENKLGKVKEWYNEKKEAKNREYLLGGVKGFILKIENNINDLESALKQDDADEAGSRVDMIGKNIKAVQKIFRVARKRSDDEARDFIKSLEAYAKAMQDPYDEMDEDVDDIDTDPVKKANVLAQAGRLENFCGVLYNSINAFIKRDEQNVPDVSGVVSVSSLGSSGAGPSGGVNVSEGRRRRVNP